MPTALTDQQIADFLQLIAGMTDQVVVIPDFDDLFIADDAELGPGLVRQSADDLEAILVMQQQRIAMEQKQADDDARAIEQSQVIGEILARCETPLAMPASAALTVLDLEPVQATSKCIADAVVECQLLSNAFGEDDDAFEVARARAVSALLAREKAVVELQEALVRTLEGRRRVAAELRSDFDALMRPILPETLKLIDLAKTNLRKELKSALETARSNLSELDRAIELANPPEFELLMQHCRALPKDLESRLKTANQSGATVRSDDRKELIAGTFWREQRPPDTELQTLDDADAAMAFDDAVRAHADARKQLTAMSAEASAEDFTAAVNQTMKLRDAAADQRQRLQQRLDTQATERKALIGGLKAQIEKLPKALAVAGTPEHQSWTQAKSACDGAVFGLTKLIAVGPRQRFDEALQSAGTLLLDAESALKDSNLEAAARTQRMEDRRQRLLNESPKRKVIALAAGDLPSDVIFDAFEIAFKTAAAGLHKRILGLNDDADAKCGADFDVLLSCAIEFGKQAKSITQNIIAQVGANLLVTQQMVGVADALKKGGVAENALKELKSLCSLMSRLVEDYNAIAGLAARVNTATVTNAGVLPAQQTILLLYAAETAPLVLHQCDRDALKLKKNRFSDALVLVENEVAALAAAATPMGVFLALYKAGDHTQILLALHAHLVAGTAVVAAGRESYQCEGENNGKFSVERQLRIGGLPGIVIHAHCKVNGTVGYGNAFHIKREARSTKKGGGVMLTAPCRALLLPSFDALGNVNPDIRLQGAVWRD